MAMGYGLGVLRIERGNENGFNAEEEAKKKKRFIGRGQFLGFTDLSGCFSFYTERLPNSILMQKNTIIYHFLTVKVAGRI